MILQDKKVIITGGVKGIGKSIAVKLLDEGASVGIVDVDDSGLSQLHEEYKNALCIKCDVTDYKQVEESVGRFFDEFKKIDVLINNAGILYSSPLISLTANGIAKHRIDAWEKVLSTNLSSVFYMTLFAVEKMVAKRTKGVIVNISSVSASGNPGQTAYSAAKAGVNAMTATWAKELGPLGIRVIGIAPGYTDTESTRLVMNESVLQEIVKKVPLRRLGKADEIADAVISVIKNDFINGKVIEVDGGLII